MSELAVQVRAEYERQIGEKIDNVKRHRPMVEHRAAVSNALRPYLSYATIGTLFEKDHSSVVHYNKEHEPMIRFSPAYRNKYAIAVEVVNNVTRGLDIAPIFHESYNVDISPRRALEDIDRIIIGLMDMKCRILAKQNQGLARK